MIASIGSNPYNIMLLIHVLAVVIGFAPMWMFPLLTRIAANGGREAADALEVSVIRFSLPALGVAAFVGFGLAGMSEKVFKMSQLWLSVGFVLWLVQMLLLFFVARPAIAAFRDGDASAKGRIAAVTGASHLILVVLLYLMIFKPGFP